MATTLRFSAELWQWQGSAAWHFLSVPGEMSDDLRERTEHAHRGFGSLRVEVTVGGSVWRTSIFPAKEGHYILPMKKGVRMAESLEVGDWLEVELLVRDL